MAGMEEYYFGPRFKNLSGILDAGDSSNRDLRDLKRYDTSEDLKGRTNALRLEYDPIRTHYTSNSFPERNRAVDSDDGGDQHTKGALNKFGDYFGEYRDDRYSTKDLKLDVMSEEYLTQNRRSDRPNRSDMFMAPMQKPPLDSDEDIGMLKYIKDAVSISTLIAENLLSHPFVVLRRQCQVHESSQHFHLLPYSLVPVMWHLSQRQGLTTLWKGLGSVFVVRGMSLAVEDAITKFTPWPKEFKSHSSLKAHGQHMMLKCLTFAIVTPFYSASLVETVQSDIASEKPGIFDVFREGLCRLISWGSPQKGRMLPIWNLVIPSVVFGLMKYLIGIIIRNISRRLLQLMHETEQIKQSEEKGAVPKYYLNYASNKEIEAMASFFGLVGSEVILYPFETILHRLHLQGTRTIIDNLDSGTQVVPILTNYKGAIDCYDTTICKEGVAGLYKGFGALLLQFSVHYFLIKVKKTIIKHATSMLNSSQPPVEASSSVSDPNPKIQKISLPPEIDPNPRPEKISLPLEYDL